MPKMIAFTETDRRELDKLRWFFDAVVQLTDDTGGKVFEADVLADLMRPGMHQLTQFLDEIDRRFSNAPDIEEELEKESEGAR